MSRLQSLFERKKQDVLNVYFTAGYPALHDTGKIIRALDDAGVDLIEVGMPYSDPLADGPTIQASGQQAIQNGMTLPLLFEQIEEARQHTDIPLVLMGYFNPIYSYGVDRFLADARSAGIDGSAFGGPHGAANGSGDAASKTSTRERSRRASTPT